MVPFILPSILLIADQCTQDEYIKNILPGLKPLLGMKDPVQVALVSVWLNREHLVTHHDSKRTDFIQCGVLG